MEFFLQKQLKVFNRFLTGIYFMTKAAPSNVRQVSKYTSADFDLVWGCVQTKIGRPNFSRIFTLSWKINCFFANFDFVWESVWMKFEFLALALLWAKAKEMVVNKKKSNKHQYLASLKKKI